MTAIELGGTIGAALAAAGTIVAMIYKAKRNPDTDTKDMLKEQLKVLQEIRDNILKLSYEVSNQFTIQHEKLTTMSNSITSLHSRLNGRLDRNVP